MKGNLDAPQLELASAKSVSDESGRDIGDNEIEAQLNKSYHKLATALPPRDRESLKQEQLKWLATREHITAAEKDEKESIQLRLTERRVAELETRARYRQGELAFWPTRGGAPHGIAIRVYDAAGNAIETHEHVGGFKEW